MKERCEIAEKDCWNLSPLYPSSAEWEKEYTLFVQDSNPLKKLLSYKHRLQEGGEVCLACIKLFLEIDRTLSKLYTYAHLKHHEDMANPLHKKQEGLAKLLYFELQKASAWIEPELLQLSEEASKKLLSYPPAAPYKIYLEKMLRLKPHTLPAEQEELIALAAKALQSPREVFSAYNNTDISFDPIVDSQGTEHPLSQGLYLLYMQSTDRTLRKNAFEGIHSRYQAMENTLAEALQGQVQSQLFLAKSHLYPSCVEAALFPHHIATKVYHSLIDTVKENISVMHRYIGFRKAHFALDKVHGYDMHVSCAPEVQLTFDFDTAVELVIDAVAMLGKDYQQTLAKGLKEQRWVDRYENAKKRTGAYSSCCYDSYPYILMNYQGTLSDVLTLAHEAGHSMHSFLSNKNQPYHYSHYTIFVAEVASTFNEELVFKALMDRVRKPEEKLYLINKKMDAIRSTLFRQTLFAEFELKIHTLAEQGHPLTPSLFKEIYKELNATYYGPDFCHDDLIQWECFRIPHFYTNFYVYQYATGISAARALVEQVERLQDPSAYLRFLSSGSSKYSLDLLKEAGVDMMTKGPVTRLIEEFSRLFEELKSCVATVKNPLLKK